MKPKEKSVALDKILRNFQPFGGQVSFEIKDTKQESFYKPIHSDYNVVRILINFLEYDGQLYISHYNQRIEITSKGTATIFDLENLGYVAQYKKERNQLKFNWVIVIIGILTLAATLLGTFRNGAGSVVKIQSNAQITPH